VEWVDTDASGHQHNSAIMRWVEAAEAELFRNLDLPECFPGAPRVQQVVNFTAKLWFSQRVTTTLETQRIDRTSMILAFEVYGHAHANSPEGLVAHGTSTTEHVPGDSALGLRWPELIQQAARKTFPNDRGLDP
jgi:acyl-CoA thioester hydrolase